MILLEKGQIRERESNYGVWQGAENMINAQQGDFALLSLTVISARFAASDPNRKEKNTYGIHRVRRTS
jgi:hypothetical protein